MDWVDKTNLPSSIAQGFRWYPKAIYNEVMNLEKSGDLKAFLDRLKETLEVGPKDFAWGYEYMGRSYFLMGNIKEGKKYAQRAVEMDDYCTLAHLLLQSIYLNEGDTTAALQEESKILLHNPEVINLR